MKKYFILFILILIHGCSSGGGGSTPTDPSTSFSVFPPNYFTSYSKTINLSGSDSTGDQYTVTFSEQTSTQTTFLGTPAIPILTQLQFTNTTTGGFISFIRNDYFTISASDRHYLGDDGDSPTVSAVTTAIPQTATIGDFGVIGTYTDNAGEVESSSWRLDDGFNGRGKLVYLFNYKDQFGNTTGSETQTFIIDESGNRLSMTAEFFDTASGITITLSGS